MKGSVLAISAVAVSASILLFSGAGISGETMRADKEVDHSRQGVVYMSPTCGCCGKWVQHMEEAGFTLERRKTHKMGQVKHHFGVHRNIASCHTAVIDGYVIEGHVPASDISQLLASQPDIEGISAPGMPVGSPGMEVPGRQADAFNVVAFDEDGAAGVFSKHR